MDKFQMDFQTQLLRAGADLVGVADISNLGLHGYTRAVALGIAYAPSVVAKVQQDPVLFRTHLADTHTKMQELVELAEHLLTQAGYAVHTPEISKTLPGLQSEVSQKRVATCAGLGWVGKNALFISREFGCGFRLGSVLTHAPFIAGTPVTESGCGQCQACKDACPYGAIQGNHWYPGIERDALLDANLCHTKREAYSESLGYKHPCGICIQVCPWVKKYARSRGVEIGGAYDQRTQA